MGKKPVVLYENENQLLNSSIDKITVKLLNKKTNKDNSQVILTTGCSPLAGTTSVSISIAIAMAASARKTLLIDCDVRKAPKYKKLNDEARIGLANYLSSKEGVTTKSAEIIYDTNIDCLSVIPCGDTNESPTRILCSNRFVSLLNEVKSSFDCIIMDFPSVSVVPDAQVMFGKVDGIIFVAALGETKRSQIRDARRIIMPYIDNYYGLIINKAPMDIFKSNVKESDYYLLDRNGFQRFEKSRAYKRKVNNDYVEDNLEDGEEDG